MMDNDFIALNLWITIKAKEVHSEVGSIIEFYKINGKDISVRVKHIPQ
jgi:hypothetical protein